MNPALHLWLDPNEDITEGGLMEPEVEWGEDGVSLKMIQDVEKEEEGTAR